MPTETAKAEPKAGDSKGAASATVEKETPKLTFPREVSHTVFIRRRKSGPNIPVEGEYIDESIQKIGASWREKQVLRGLTSEEEERWLPRIIGSNPKSPNWETATKDYWENISRPVPITNKDGSGGLQLEVGLFYKTEADYLADMNAPKTKEGAIINPKGEPISLADYILWRFCLLHGRVANNPEDINKSAKIEFYIFSKEKEILDKKTKMESRKRSMQLLYKRMHERDWVDHVLRLLIQQDQETEYGIKDIAKLDPNTKDVLMERYAMDKPEIFLAYGEDKHLEMKSFIEVCIAMGLLTRIANTSTISYDGNAIGNDLEQAVAFLRDPANQHTLGTLKAQSLVRP